MKINCIAIDDEPLALEILQKQIEKISYLKLKATFHSASQALKYLSDYEVDCIFLDIEMPDFNGVELAKIINQFSEKPKIVFVTAFHKYIVNELKEEVIDYLLKPFSFEEFKTVADKIAKSQLLKEPLVSEESNTSFFLRIDARQVKLFTEDILFLESMGDYVKIFTASRKSPLIPLITLKKIKTYLPHQTFLQINRSQIINLQKIDSFGKNDLSINEHQFMVSDTFKKEFELIKESLFKKNPR